VRIAAAIAERFSRQPSYRELREAEDAARQRLAEEQHAAEEAAAKEQAFLEAAAAIPEPQPDDAVSSLDPRRLYIEASHHVVLHAPIPAPLPKQEPSRAAAAAQQEHQKSEPTRSELEDLIHSVLVEPSVPLPAKLLEFPRELVAPRKARPRIVEGPLVQEAAAATGDDAEQLRIFEVENAAISHQPMPPVNSVAEAAVEAPVWSTIRLDDNRARRWESVAAESDSSFALPPQTAPLTRRALAAAIDAAYISGAFIMFAAVFVVSANPVVTSATVEYGAAVFVLLYLLYQWLFFSYAESTPGMRSARIALCTFEDGNPTRRAMRWRIAAVLLAACPLGLGFLWAIVDQDGLGWHDRIAHMYQRSY
jgi:uncharacterized RDD family membrane protein YckC